VARVERRVARELDDSVQRASGRLRLRMALILRRGAGEETAREPRALAQSGPARCAWPWHHVPCVEDVDVRAAFASESDALLRSIIFAFFLKEKG
jgi:hypothetical protein